MKTCSKCKEDKEVKEFFKDKAKNDKLSTICKRCTSNRRTLSRYGITMDTYDNMLVSQGGTCAICRTDQVGGRGGLFHIDHCHATGKVRGLLCHNCNIGLGAFKDKPIVMSNAIQYLRETSDG